ncbi:MAG: RnfABCDGE type electron transport complex subunit B [Clostridia bacterium]|nr:RnfABCDGE type electron transport complex subunit B [Clostridia bacterium]
MNPILFAVLLVSAIGLIAGLGLSVASVVMAVPVNEKTEKIRECLPGANCGACGFSGCDGYADALSTGKTTNTALCSPGGRDAAEAIAAITGLSVSESVPMTAVVHCCGNHASAVNKLEYMGIESCRMAIQVFGGPKACAYGCLGFGDCRRECPFEAITICDGVAWIDPDKCHACKKCVAVCPKHLISVVPKNAGIPAVLCSNHDKGAATRKACSAGCIGCMKCVKNCKVGAVSVINFCAKIDPEKCVSCGVCAEGCPVKCIHIPGSKAAIIE